MALETVGLGRLVALADLTRGVTAGECVALIGANGSGKSTAVRTIAGLLAPSTGHVAAGRGRRRACAPENGPAACRRRGDAARVRRGFPHARHAPRRAGRRHSDAGSSPSSSWSDPAGSRCAAGFGHRGGVGACRGGVRGCERAAAARGSGSDRHGGCRISDHMLRSDVGPASRTRSQQRLRDCCGG